MDAVGEGISMGLLLVWSIVISMMEEMRADGQEKPSSADVADLADLFSSIQNLFLSFVKSSSSKVRQGNFFFTRRSLALHLIVH
jgi:hypothetical protein